MRHCPHCGAEAVVSSPSAIGPLHCPRCDTNLQQQRVGKNSVNICTRCGGLWVGKNVFQDICTREEEQESVLAFKQDLITAASQASAQKPQRAYIPCPECGKLMNHKNFSGSGTVLDWCRDHGSWFDRNELQNIVRFIREGGLKKAREREEQKLKEREDSLRMQEFRMAALERRLEPGMARMETDKGDTLMEFLSKMF
jgi:Zn-finger nucleic acid-binding protein